MSLLVSRASAARWALTSVILSFSVFANEDSCQSEEIDSMQGRGACLLQGAPTRAKMDLEAGIGKAQTQKKLDVTKLIGTPEGLKKTLSWSTNVGQPQHSCKGSHFQLDFNGTQSGMVVTNGMLLKKGDCAQEPKTTKPVLTKGLSCDAEATGCHMWCAPVWQSYYDTTDWSGFDARCKGWDGSFNATDSDCAKTGRLFTWARAEIPSTKNELDMTFAIPHNCASWGAPLWVTIYDPTNYGKSYRWCFNKQDDFGGCDKSEIVSLSKWHDHNFKFASFMEKHGYAAINYVLELSVYSEFEPLEVLINNLKLRYVKEETTTKAPALKKEKPKPCGSEVTCGIDHQCCRKLNSTVDARCCPIDWKCCEDSCCPQYYTCSVTGAGHTCTPPESEELRKPLLCQL